MHFTCTIVARSLAINDLSPQVMHAGAKAPARMKAKSQRKKAFLTLRRGLLATACTDRDVTCARSRAK